MSSCRRPRPSPPARERPRRSDDRAPHSSASSPTVTPGEQAAQPLEREQHARHERLARGGVVADRQQSRPSPPRITSWCATRPGQPDRVDRRVARHQRRGRLAVPEGASSLSRGAARRSRRAARPRRLARRTASSGSRRSRSSAPRRRARPRPRGELVEPAPPPSPSCRRCSARPARERCARSCTTASGG